MPINASSDNPLYLAYGHAGPSLALIIPAVLLNITVIFGVPLNTFVVVVTIFAKNLHATSNFLLAMISLFEVFHQLGHLIFLGIVLSGLNFVSFSEAVRLDSVMLLASHAALCAMAGAAFDRLFVIISPGLHARLNRKLYLAAHAVVCLCFGMYGTLNIYSYHVTVHPDAPTTGCLAELLTGGPIGDQWFMISGIVNGLCVLLYLLVWLVIRCKRGVTKETNRRLLKSLLIILLINIGGYFINIAFYQLLAHLYAILNPILVWHLGFICGILLNIGSGCNAVVLYITSTDYRKTFKRALHNLLAVFASLRFWAHHPSSMVVLPLNTTQQRKTTVHHLNLNERSKMQTQRNSAAFAADTIPQNRKPSRPIPNSNYFHS